ncbi:hypothetical protein ACFLZB_01680 [Nanoarchaeota archaeon]
MASGKISIRAVVELLLFLIPFVIILGWVLWYFLLPGTSAVDAVSCNQQVIFGATSKTILQKGFFTVNCPSKSTTFVNEDLDEIYEEIARGMADCIWKFGEGKLDFNIAGYLTSRKTCIVCDYFTFAHGSDAQKVFANEDSYQKFFTYMNTHNVPKYISKGEKTYLEYFNELQGYAVNKQGSMNLIWVPFEPDEENVIFFSRQMTGANFKIAEWISSRALLDEIGMRDVREAYGSFVASILKEIDGKEYITADQYAERFGHIKSNIVVGPGEDFKWQTLCDDVYN